LCEIALLGPDIAAVQASELLFRMDTYERGLALCTPTQAD
jgi:hypothetical protein